MLEPTVERNVVVRNNYADYDELTYDEISEEEERINNQGFTRDQINVSFHYLQYLENTNNYFFENKTFENC